MPELLPASLDAQSLNLARQFQILKRVPRSGWLLRGVPPGEVENVAAHTSGTGLAALLLAELVEEPVDRGRLLSICLLHDLAEAVLTDLPWPAVRHLPAGSKAAAEQSALADMLATLPFAADWLGLWQEYVDVSTPEARLAHDADRLDMLLQASAYEAAGRRGLDEFWRGTGEQTWYFPASRSLFQALAVARAGE